MQTNFNLFTTNSEQAGFRLNYLEIFNWGTFHQQIYKIAPQGNNSLLTGANASGKSTLIDALLSLLVPTKKDRFYNQSSGNEKKGDRTEETYVLGQYRNIQEDGETSSKIKQLREKNNSYSVILASFENEQQQIVTLFQIRWFVNGELKRLLGYSANALTIEEDFSFSNNKIQDWKKLLEKKYNSNVPMKRIEFYDTIQSYQEKMMRSFGLRSDKAFLLFNQIIGVKFLNDLDNFIRHNILEQKNAEEEYIKLNESFATQIAAKTNFEKVREQITLLKPIDEKALQLEKIKLNLSKFHNNREMAVLWFAQKQLDLANEKIAQLNNQHSELQREILQLNQNKERLKEEEQDLNIAIKNDEVGKQIKNLEKDIKELETIKNKRQIKFNQYNQKAKILGLPENPNKAMFVQNRDIAQQKENECQNELEQQQEALRYAKNEQEQIAKEIQENIETLNILQKNQNNISGRVAQIRQLIAENIGADIQEIPFIGELITVKENEKHWENAIEKLLHNFALRLIVPEKYYMKVNQFVNTHNLRGRVVYHCYEEVLFIQDNQNLPENSLFNKLQFKENSPYSEWVKDNILRQYNYACVDSIDEFNHYREKAITQQGLIKSTQNKHEKDDREHTNRRENYVLGWDNQAKIHAIQTWVRNLQQQQKQQVENIRKINEIKENIAEKLLNFRDIYQNFTDFEEIDWQETTQIIQEKMDNKKVLESANEKVKSLQNQLDKVKQKLSSVEEKIIAKEKENWHNEEENKRANQRLTDNQAIIAQLPAIETTQFAKENAHELIDIVYDNIDDKQKNFQAILNQQETQCKDKKNQIEIELRNLIKDFKRPPETITRKFKDWYADTNTLPENIEFINEYQELYQRLVKEDLVRFEKQYNDFLREHIKNGVTNFKMFFNNWEDDIKETIAVLNKSLRAINFGTTPPTYIQLVNTQKINSDIKEFKKELEDALPNFRQINASMDNRRIHFEEKIQPFMEHLKDEEWRKKVMNVKNWFSYKVEEFYKETGEKYQTYESMGQLSGGEKAQLTYTILGAAIAYQFGLTQDDTKSLRFIAIDEAFKAQDEEKARYLISLCKQLHLQLLVVTPSDNIHIVEDDISFVHFVERHGNESRLINMSIAEFKNLRERFQENDSTE